jgi:hypothetical protein
MGIIRLHLFCLETGETERQHDNKLLPTRMLSSKPPILLSLRVSLVFFFFFERMSLSIHVRFSPSGVSSRARQVHDGTTMTSWTGWFTPR